MPNLPDRDDAAMMRPGEVARLLGVTTATVAAMPDLHPVRLPSGHRRYRRDEVEKLLHRDDG
jgi:DNA-binding transcriptional MerR regulator